MSPSTAPPRHGLLCLFPSRLHCHRLCLRKSLQDSYSLLDQVPLLPTATPKHTIFLNLDETLIHSTPHPPLLRNDFAVRTTMDGLPMTFYVLKRLGLDRLLADVNRSFELIMFTSGLREYASLVLDRLDPTGTLISHWLYWDFCREIKGKLVKDLSNMGRELHRMVNVDDNLSSYLLQRENVVPMKPFIEGPADHKLDMLQRFFEAAGGFDDMR